MELKVKLDIKAMMPKRAYENDAGLDILSPETVCIEAKGSEVIDTGLHIEIPKGYVGMIKSKSGLNLLNGIITEGVIDSGYTGSIAVKLYNMSNYPYYIARGNKIAQLVIMPIETPTLVEVNKIKGSERGNNGFGSTGK